MPLAQKPVGVIGAHFTVLVWIVTVVCFMSLLVIFVLALTAGDPLSKAQEAALETGKYAFTTTLGAVHRHLGRHGIHGARDRGRGSRNPRDHAM